MPLLRGLFLGGLSTEGNLCFKIDWAGLIVGSKFTVFALFYFVSLRAIFQVKAAEGLIFAGSYFRNFTVYHARQREIWDLGTKNRTFLRHKTRK